MLQLVLADIPSVGTTDKNCNLITVFLTVFLKHHVPIPLQAQCIHISSGRYYFFKKNDLRE